MLTISRKGSPNKHKAEFGLTDFYREYIESIEPGTKYDISKAVHRYIIEKFWLAVRDEIIYNYKDFYMSYPLGYIRVKRMATRIKNLKYNYGHYRKTGEKLYHMNEHTNEFYFKFSWYGSKIQNRKIYKFVANRTNLKRVLPKHIFNTPANKLMYY